MALAIILAGCKGKTQNPGSSGNNDLNGEVSINFSNCDLVVITDGQMQFYDGVQQQLKPYFLEKDSVVNALFINQQELFYSVSNKDGLILKHLSLDDKNPQPEMIANWQLPLDRCIDERGGKVSAMWLSDDGDYLGIQKDFSWDGEFYGFTDMSACHLVDGKVFEQEELDAQDYDYLHFFHEDLPYQLFEQRGSSYYYVSDKDEHCLTDNLDLMGYLKIEDEWELEDLDFMPRAFSPDGKAILFSAIMPWGDFGVSTYCVSSLDGDFQRILEGSEAYDVTPKWLSDGSLVFASYEMASEDDPNYENYWQGMKPCVRITTPDGNTKVLCQGVSFATKPVSNKEMVN